MSVQPSIRVSLAGVAVATCIAGLTAVTGVEARVTRIVIDTKTSPAFAGQSFGAAGQYETIAGRAFGELDPNDPHNAVITDIQLGQGTPTARSRYDDDVLPVTKPVDMARASGFLWHDVPNRGGNIIINAIERDLGDIGLSERLAGRQRRRDGDPGEPRHGHHPLGRGADGAREP